MIDIQQLYLTVNEYLTLKGKAGYASNAQFNDDVNRAQTALQNFYIKIYGESNMIEESLSPFIVSKTLTLTNGVASKPSDFRHKISAKYQYAVNNDDCTDSSLKTISLNELRVNEWELTHESPIRSASLSKKRGYYGVINDVIRASFQTGEIILDYIKQPPTATRAVTLNSVTQNEDYNSGGSTHLVWNPQDYNDLVDIMLFYKALQIRETAIINFIKANERVQ